MDQVVLSLIAVVLGLLSFRYYSEYKRRQRVFDDAKIPYRKPWPIFGNMLAIVFRRVSMPEMIQRIYDSSAEARYVGFFDFDSPVLMIKDPELIKSIAIKNFDSFANHRGFVDPRQEPLFGRNLFSLKDDEWKGMRNMLSPAFTSSKIKSMYKLMLECADNFAKVVAKDAEERPGEDGSMDFWELFSRYTTDVIASTAFGISIDSIAEPDNDFYKMGKQVTFTDASRAGKIFVIRNFPLLSKLLKVRLIGDEVKTFFDDVVRQTIEGREKRGIVRPDMIQLMMEYNRKNAASRLSNDDMTSQAFVFFLGGFDSTATTMAFMALELAVRQDVQSKLRGEIDEVLGRTGGKPPTYEDINNMKYLDAVLNEILRYYPLATMQDRVCSKSFQLPPPLPGAEAFEVKEGSNLWFPVYALHRDPGYFEDPDKFEPERWLDKRNLNNPAFIPFGIGPRACIGNRFAILESKVVFFHILALCILEPSNGTTVPITFDKRKVLMSPLGGFKVNVRPRNTAARL
ncbi:cytochrome P450 9e2-like [Prorops nasuta]|uniref:cytochrome P450 9e2-like n=1 Tax=Prorops nasuta TaxID=863751 RepID=UPI0034CD4BCB